MLKTLSLLAFGLLTFTGIQTAQAGFLSKCTAAVGKKGGKEAYSCVNMSDPQEDPNFFKSFLENHCQGRINPADKRACRIAQNKSAEERKRLSKSVGVI
jgi:hypothetical protein